MGGGLHIERGWGILGGFGCGHDDYCFKLQKITNQKEALLLPPQFSPISLPLYIVVFFIYRHSHTLKKATIFNISKFSERS